MKSKIREEQEEAFVNKVVFGLQIAFVSVIVLVAVWILFNVTYPA